MKKISKIFESGIGNPEEYYFSLDYTIAGKTDSQQIEIWQSIKDLSIEIKSSVFNNDIKKKYDLGYKGIEIIYIRLLLWMIGYVSVSSPNLDVFDEELLKTINKFQHNTINDDGNPLPITKEFSEKDFSSLYSLFTLTMPPKIVETVVMPYELGSMSISEKTITPTTYRELNVNDLTTKNILTDLNTSTSDGILSIYKTFIPKNQKVFLLGVRSLFSERRKYDDDLYLISTINDGATFDVISIKYNTEPSGSGESTMATGKGFAVMLPSIVDYRVGVHAPNTDRSHIALLQSSNCQIIRDSFGQNSSENEIGNFGLDIHRGKGRSTSSAGCHTIEPQTWESFFPKVKNLMEQNKQETIKYVFLDLSRQNEKIYLNTIIA